MATRKATPRKSKSARNVTIPAEALHKTAPIAHGPPSRRKTRGRRTHRILVGTASWTDPGFVADWYPPKLPARERLAWYARHFNLVEVNSSFYAVPSVASVARWSQQTPDGFVFDVKLHRLLSRHSTTAKLLPPELRPKASEVRGRVRVTPALETALVETILTALQPLRDSSKLGALLLQMSPSFGPRDSRLEELEHVLGLLKSHRVAVELRNRGWTSPRRLEETLAFFRERGVTLVTVDAPAGEHFMTMPSDDWLTSPRLAYLRAHGRNERGYVRGRSVAERFDYDYSEEEIDELVERADRLADFASETHVIFNNNKGSYAPRAAEQFRKVQAVKGKTP